MLKNGANFGDLNGNELILEFVPPLVLEIYIRNWMFRFY